MMRVTHHRRTGLRDEPLPRRRARNVSRGCDLGSMTTPLQVPGLIRRVRRQADLSQRDLAARLGVDQSVVARWETGELCPSLRVLERILAVGGFRLAVLVVAEQHEQAEAAAPAEASPMRPDAVRDRQRRRFPSHLDVHDRQEVLAGERRPHAPGRGRRDRLRAATGVVPSDHPTHQEIVRARAEVARERRVALAQRVRRLPEWTPFPRSEPCRCPAPCWLEPTCGDDCPCRCETPSVPRWPAAVGASRRGGANLGLL